jgi:hypothetical protein
MPFMLLPTKSVSMALKALVERQGMQEEVMMDNGD